MCVFGGFYGLRNLDTLLGWNRDISILFWGTSKVIISSCSPRRYRIYIRRMKTCGFDKGCDVFSLFIYKILENKIILFSSEFL